MSNQTFGKSILDLTELSKKEIISLIDLAIRLKKAPQEYANILNGKILGMIFEKSSTRTRVSFEAGMLQLGGQVIVMNGKETQIGRGEPIKDTAPILSSYLDALMIRTFEDKKVQDLVKYGSIPVINGLTDDHHPCQVLADLMTIYEHKGTFEQVKLAYVGDGNNMAHSLLIGGAIVGMDVSIACPKGYEMKAEYVTCAKKLAQKSGATLEITQDPKKAVEQADFVYTDVWSSMGWEEEQAEREAVFGQKYQVNAQLVAGSKAEYKFLHCLPAHRGEEVTAEIIDGSHSVIYQEAENRLHAQKALLVKILVKNQ